MSALSIVRRVPVVAAFLWLLFVCAAPARAGDGPAPVDVNKATEDELLEIPGVGEATAAKIVKGRPYASLDELSKSGLSEKTIAKIKPYLKVGKPKAVPAARSSGKVDLNKATLEELLELPGVGDATAKKIIDGRPYASIDDLSKAGLGDKLIEKLTPLVTVGRAKASGGGDKGADKGGEKGGDKPPASTGSGKVDLNKATLDELLALPGVGDVTAQKIIDGRPYASIGDLSKAGLGDKLIEKLTPLVMVGKPKPSGGKIDLNEASVDELMELPGVGEVTADKIVKGRPYTSIEDLESAGLSERLIDKLTPYVKVTASKAGSGAREPASGGGHGQVWVNTASGIFHREGSHWYGKTKEGKYMTEAAALKAGFREAGKPPPDDD